MQATLTFGPEDRDEHGRIRVTPPDDMSLRSMLDSTLADFGVTATLPDPAVPVAEPSATSATRVPYRPTQAQIAVGALLAALALFLGITWRAEMAATLPATTLPATATTLPTVAAMPTMAATDVAAGRLLIAFAAPDGTPLGAIESTRAITPTAHYGNNWIQADVQGSGLVWLRVSDAPDLAIVGPDLAPRPPSPQLPQQRPAVWQPNTAAFVPAATDPPPPPPTRCVEAGVPGKMVSACGEGDMNSLQEQAKAQWLATYGGNVGVVTTPTPYGGG